MYEGSSNPEKESTPSKPKVDGDGVGEVSQVAVYITMLALLLLTCFTALLLFASLRSHGVFKKTAFYTFPRLRPFTTPSPTPYLAPEDIIDGWPRRNFTLVCVFVYIPPKLWDKAVQCTDFVHIRIFTLGLDYITKEFAFESNYTRFKSMRNNEEMRRNALQNCRKLSKKFGYAFFYIGMWGAMFTRMRYVAPLSKISKAFDTFSRGMRGEGWDEHDWNGYAIINTVAPTNADDLLRWLREGDVQFSPGKRFLHTIMPLPPHLSQYWEEYLVRSLRHATLAGITTTNTLTIPPVVLSDVAEMKIFGPPNIFSDIDNITGTIGLLRNMSRYARLVSKNGLCFTISTAINYAGYPYEIALGSRSFSRRRIRRYTRSEFAPLFKFINGSKDIRDNRLFTYFRFNDTVFMYTSTSQLTQMVKQMTGVYSSGKCIVFEDITEDSENTPWEQAPPFPFLSIVSHGMEERWGRAFPGVLYQ